MRYDIQNRVCHRQAEAAALFGVQQDMENEPEAFIRQGFVCEESLADYSAFFDAMRGGVPSGSVTVRLNKKEGSAWFRCDYTSIFSRSGAPLQSIISFYDVTELREKEIAYEKWKQTYQAMPSQTINYYEYNLTRDMFDREEGSLLCAVPPDVPRTLSDVADYLAGRCVYEADRDRFRAFFSRARLLESYRKGLRSEQQDMRRVDCEGRALWTAASVQLIADPYSSDIKCFLLLRDVDREKREELNQRARSNTDPLTGLLNRTALIEQLTALFEESRVGETHALMMLDVDGFKRVNDTFGHQFGDGVLVGIAGDLRAMMRADDFISRLGGDEYVVCLRDVPATTNFLEKRARLICQAMCKQFGSDVAISGSVGIALYPQDGMDFDTLYRKADKALYYAKQHGRDLYVFYNEEDMGEGACETEHKAPQGEPRRPARPQAQRTLLVVDDVEINRELLAEIFRTEYHILMADCGEKALEFLQRSDSQISAVLLDLIMPGLNGLQVLEKMRGDAYLSTIPVVVVSSMSEQEGGLKAIELGASDFVSKPFDPRLVRLRVAGAIQKRENEELRAQNRYLLVQKSDESRHQNQLRYLAEHDSLTNICNKTAFYRKTKQMLEKLPDTAFAMIAFDIGHFRVINDIFGHEEGDRLLRYIAARLQSGLNGRATYGRIDADDFTICLPADDETLQTLFANADAAMGEYDLPFDVVLQWGVYFIDDPSLPISLMHDRAGMAKRTIKGNYLRRVAYYDDALREEMLAEQEITGEMNAALEQGQFEVYLQPKCSLADGRVIGAEALARWIHPTKGFMSPAQFIPIFEKNGFIMKLDAYIWERACQLLSRWRHLPIHISANLSRVDLYNPNLCKILTGLTDKYGVARDSLELEITESTYAENARLMLDVIAELKSQGFVVEMDDFGSGYSSLNMLKEIPVDVLKIDMRFLSGGDSTGRGDSILDSVVNMAHRLGLPVVAEGVETREQVDFLSSLRCDSAQGYYYYRPMPVQEFEALLARVDKHSGE
ncbi:MAG: EAL domain-containing protein [Eubacteriales bacterium]|nr:EAL domain-containing protein [Eubacteriales bacterium]